MKKHYILILAFLAVICSKAQTPNFVKETPAPTSIEMIFLTFHDPTFSSNSRAQHIYLPTDLNAVSGYITSIYLKKTTTASSTLSNVTVSLGQPGQANYAAVFSTPFVDPPSMTPCLTVPSFSFSGQGWVKFQLTTPFLYDNTKPLIFDLRILSASGSTVDLACTQLTTPPVTNIKSIFADMLLAGAPLSNLGFGGGLTVQWPDFGIDVSVAPPVKVPPVANFDFTLGIDTLWINSPSSIFNTSSNADTVYWNISGYNPISSTGPWTEFVAPRANYDFGGVMDSTRNFNRKFNAAGYYLIKLYAKNNNGMNSVEKPVFVSNPTSKPTALWSIGGNEGGRFGEMALLDQSFGGPVTHKWSLSPACYSCADTNKLFSDSDPSTFLSMRDPGVYTVCLKVTNTLGTDSLCKKEYLTVRPGFRMCSVDPAISPDLNGYLRSDGAMIPRQPYNYKVPSCSGFTISPCTDTIVVNLERLRMRNGDSIFVRSGSFIGPKLRSWGGSNFAGMASSLKTLKFAGQDLFITFSGTASATPIADSGFVISWNSKPATFSKPVAGFTMPDTIYSGYLLNLFNTSTGAKKFYSWDLNGDGIFGDSINANPTNLIYTTTSQGLRTIKLRTYNCVGSDTFSKTFVLMPVIERPAASFIVNRRDGVFATDTFRFTDKSKGATSWEWRFTPSSVAYISGTSSKSQHPEVILLAAQKYNVTLYASNPEGIDSVTLFNLVESMAYEQPTSILNPSSISMDIGITRVKAGNTIDTITPATTPVYTPLHTLQKLTVYRGASYPLSIYRSSNLDLEAVKVWIDYNRNTRFGDAAELIYSKDSSTALVNSLSFTVPSDAPVGITRMRVGVAAVPVSTFSPTLVGAGVYEDYGITVGVDEIRPVLILKGSAVHKSEQFKPYIEAGATASDNIEGDISSRVQISGTVDVSRAGYYTLKYYVNDYYGNVSDTVIRMVQIEVNQTGPSITLNGSDTIQMEVFGSFTEPGFSAMDNFGTNITNLVVRNSTLDTSVVGRYPITYTVTDAFGFSIQKIRIVWVRDTQKPVVKSINMRPSASDTVIHQKGDVLDDLNYLIFSDNYWSPEMMTFTRTGLLNVNTRGIYTLRYKVKDGSGNESDEYVLYVYVRDQLAPVILLNGQNPMTIPVSNDVVTDPGATATDNLTLPSSLNIVSNWNQVVKTNIVNTTGYNVTYSTIDEDGNVGEKIRRVMVVDNAPPVITLLGNNPMEMARGQFFAAVEPGYKVTDNYSAPANITVKIDTSNLNTDGEDKEYVVYYTATDESGNQSQQVFRSVKVRAWLTANKEIAAENKISLFPNPSTGLFYMTVKAGQFNEVNVYSISGALVMTKQIAANTGELTLDMHDMKDGVYLITLKGEGGVEKIKAHLVR